MLIVLTLGLSAGRATTSPACRGGRLRSSFEHARFNFVMPISQASLAAFIDKGAIVPALTLWRDC